MDRFGDSRRRIGTCLGAAAVLAERAFSADPDPRLHSASAALEVRTIVAADPSRAPAEYERARRHLTALQASGADRQGAEYRQAAEAHARAQVALHRSRLYPENRYRVSIQFLRVGRTVLAALPFEVLAEIGLRLKERHPDAVVVSCAAGYQGYLPLRHEYARGGYEASAASTHFEEGTGDRVLELLLERVAI
jgi:hypothetical protein